MRKRKRRSAQDIAYAPRLGWSARFICSGPCGVAAIGFEKSGWMGRFGVRCIFGVGGDAVVERARAHFMDLRRYRPRAEVTPRSHASIIQPIRRERVKFGRHSFAPTFYASVPRSCARARAALLPARGGDPMQPRRPSLHMQRRVRTCKSGCR